ncbi:hypothetical protein JW859_01315 [bacterium]|nr:hypothetical protein [bacterium]
MRITLPRRSTILLLLVGVSLLACPGTGHPASADANDAINITTVPPSPDEAGTDAATNTGDPGASGASKLIAQCPNFQPNCPPGGAENAGYSRTDYLGFFEQKVRLYYFTNVEELLYGLNPGMVQINYTGAPETQRAIQQTLMAQDQKLEDAEQAELLAKNTVAKLEGEAVTAQSAYLTAQQNHLAAQQQPALASADDPHHAAAQALVDQRQKDEDAAKTASEQAAAKLKTARTAWTDAEKSLEQTRQDTELQRQLSTLEFADLRDHGPVFACFGRADCNDPLRRVTITGLPGSKQLIIRGLADDVRKVVHLIKTIDAPAPQARLTLWTLEINGDTSEKGNRRMNEALMAVEEEFSDCREQLAAVISILKDVITEKVYEKTDGMISSIRPNYPLERFLFYDYVVLHRLGFNVEEALPFETLLKLGLEPDHSSIRRKAFDGRAHYTPPFDLDAGAWRYFVFTRYIIPDPADISTLGEALVVLTLAREEYRNEVLDEFECRLTAHLRNRELLPEGIDCLRMHRLRRIVNADLCDPSCERPTKKKEYAGLGLNGNQQLIVKALQRSALKRYFPLSQILQDEAEDQAYRMFLLLLQQWNTPGIPERWADCRTGNHPEGDDTCSADTHSPPTQNEPDDGYQLWSEEFLPLQQQPTTPPKSNPSTDHGNNTRDWNGLATCYFGVRGDAELDYEGKARELARQLVSLRNNDMLWLRMLTEQLVSGIKPDTAQNATSPVATNMRLARDADDITHLYNSVQDYLRNEDNFYVWLYKEFDLARATVEDYRDQLLKDQRSFYAPEETEPDIAKADALLKQLNQALEDEIDEYFVHPMLERLRRRVADMKLGVGVIGRTGLLATNRMLSRVDPRTSAQLDMVTEDNYLEGFKQVVAVLNDVQTQGVYTGRNFDLAKQLANFADTEHTEIYGITSGSLFQVTPIFDPSGEALRFKLDYDYSTRITEPDGSTGGPQASLPRVEKHSVNIEIQLNNFEIREGSRIETNAALGIPEKRTGGIPFLKEDPLFKDIPLIGYFTRRRGHAAIVQQNLLFAQAVVYPTIGDIVYAMTTPVPDLIDLVSQDEEIYRPTSATPGEYFGYVLQWKAEWKNNNTPATVYCLDETARLKQLPFFFQDCSPALQEVLPDLAKARAATDPVSAVMVAFSTRGPTEDYGLAVDLELIGVTRIPVPGATPLRQQVAKPDPADLSFRAFNIDYDQNQSLQMLLIEQGLVGSAKDDQGTKEPGAVKTGKGK